MKFIPAILPHSFEELDNKLNILRDVSVNFEFVQIDLSDGILGKEITWFPNGETLPDSYVYQFDLMVTNWEEVLRQVVSINIKNIILHVDTFSDEDIRKSVDIAKENSLTLGISISNDKEVSIHIEFIKKFKELYEKVFVQVMGINEIGIQGQGFSKDCLSRISKIREQLPDITIQVDGGIKDDSARLVKENGGDRVVVGSYIFGVEDVKERIKKITEI